MNYSSFIFAFFSTAGFAVLFNIPKKHIFQAAIIGGLGWFLYSNINNQLHSVMLPAFLASLLIGILGAIFSRIYKQPVTIFIIPGIIPIVPGYGLYYTMLKIIQQDYQSAKHVGFESIIIAILIASGLMVASALNKIVTLQIKKN